MAAWPRPTWVALGVVAAVANLNFLLQPLFGDPPAAGAVEASALSVPGQPHAWAYRVGDAVFGLAAAALSAGVLARPGSWTRPRPSGSAGPVGSAGSAGSAGKGRPGGAARVFAIGLAVFGLGNALAAAVPESSVTAVSVADALGSVGGAVHGAASLVAGAGQVLAVLAALVGVVRARAGAATTLWTAAAAVVLTGFALGQTVGAALGVSLGGGTAQQLQLEVASAWLVAVGVAVAWSPSRRGPAAAPEEDTDAACGRLPDGVPRRSGGKGGP